MGRVVHFEVPADDPERAIAFYQQAFGWDIQKWEGPMDYWLVMTGPPDKPGIDGGLSRREGPASVVQFAIDVESLDDTIAAVTGAGGSVEVPKMAVPGVGWLAYFRDTEGNLFGAMEANTSAA